METPHPTVTGPDEQGAYDIQNGAETFCMRRQGSNLFYEQHGFDSFEDACSAINLVASELHATLTDRNACFF